MYGRGPGRRSIPPAAGGHEERPWRSDPILATTFAVHWACFWTLNGLDKFVNGRDLGPLAWAGTNWGDEVDRYLRAVGIDDGPVIDVLATIAAVELIVAVPFLWSVLRLASKRRDRYLSGVRALEVGLVGSLLVFLAFSAIDVVVGDRGTLLAHATYLIAVGLTYLVARFEGITADMLHHVRVGAQEISLHERSGEHRIIGDLTAELPGDEAEPAWMR